MILVEVEFGGKTLEVVKEDDKYQVVVDGVVRHPDCDADAVIRAMGHYLQGTENKSPSK